MVWGGSCPPCGRWAALPLPARTAALLRSGGGARAPQMRGGFGAASGLRPRRGAGAAVCKARQSGEGAER